MKTGTKRYVEAVGMAYAAIQVSGLLICTAAFPFMDGSEVAPATVNAQAFLHAAEESFTVLLLYTAIPTLIYAGILGGVAGWMRSRRWPPWRLYLVAFAMAALLLLLLLHPGPAREPDPWVNAFFVAALLLPSLAGAAALHRVAAQQGRMTPVGEPPVESRR